MSALLERGLDAERKAQADAADLAITRAVVSHRFDTIRALCTAKATVHGYTSYPGLADLYERSIRTLCAELDTLHGRNATPQNGCFHVGCFLGDADVLVEFEYEGESGDGWNEPREEESVTLLCALVNGVWVDADQFSESVQEAWNQRAIDWMTEQRQSAADDAAEARYREREAT
jgi:hypothetical protein